MRDFGQVIYLAARVTPTPRAASASEPASQRRKSQPAIELRPSPWVRAPHDKVIRFDPANQTATAKARLTGRDSPRVTGLSDAIADGHYRIRARRIAALLIHAQLTGRR